jgi:hypothetical protein
MNEYTDMHIENFYAKNVYGSPNYVEEPAEALGEGKVTLDLETMLEATEQGLTRTETASMIGCTYVAVCRACKKWADEGVELKREACGVRNTTKERAKILLERGDLSDTEIGSKLNISRQRVGQIRKKLEGEK